MSTATLELDGESVSCLGVLLLLIALVVFVGLGISHAIARHGADAEAVRACLDNGNQVAVWFNPYNEHYIRVCAMPEGYGLQIVAYIKGQIEELTAFIKRGDWQEVSKYLMDSGAFQTWPK